MQKHSNGTGFPDSEVYVISWLVLEFNTTLISPLSYLLSSF